MELFQILSHLARNDPNANFDFNQCWIFTKCCFQLPKRSNSLLIRFPSPNKKTPPAECSTYPLMLQSLHASTAWNFAISEAGPRKKMFASVKADGKKKKSHNKKARIFFSFLQEYWAIPEKQNRGAWRHTTSRGCWRKKFQGLFY